MPTPEDIERTENIKQMQNKIKEFSAIEAEPNFTLLSGKIYRATADSAAFDLYYNGSEPMVIGDMPVAIPTGVRTEFKPGFVCVIKEKSGLASKGIELKAGVIDADYRDEWKVIARNPMWIFDTDAIYPSVHPDWKPFVINPGMRIAQFLFMRLPLIRMKAQEGAEIVLSDEARKGGLGSTGLS
jgi:dUTPase